MFENTTSSSPVSSSQKPRWYLARGGERHGPIADAKLFSLAAEDMIAPSDLVWRPGFLAWISAGEMPGLLIPPPLPNPMGGRAMPSADLAPRLSVVTETHPIPATPHEAPESVEEEPARAAEPDAPVAHEPAAHEPAASTVASASLNWGGNKNLEALRDALRSAPNYAP